jgi:O-antigen ligase
MYSVVGIAAYSLAVLNYDKIQATAAYIIAFHVALAIFEEVRGVSLFYGEWKIADAQRYAGFLRVASTPADPNYLALTVLLLIPFAWPWVRRQNRALVAAYVVGAAFTLAFTFSRSLLAGGAVAVLVSLFERRSRRHALRVAILFCIGSALAFAIFPSVADGMGARVHSMIPGAGDPSTAQRYQVQSITLGIAKEHLLAGVGPGNSQNILRPLTTPLVALNSNGELAYTPQTSVLDTYLLTLVELGVFGLIALALLLMQAARSCRLSMIHWYVLIASGAMLLTLDALTFAPLWFFVGAVLGASRQGGLSRDSSARSEAVTVRVA